MTEWPSDWVTKWPSDRVTEWHSDRVTEWQSDQVTKWPSTQVTRKLRRRLTVWYIWIYKQCLFSFFFYLFPCITNSAAVLLTPDPSARADGGLSVATGSMSRGQYCKERSNLREIWLMLISIQQKMLFWRLFTSIASELGTVEY